MTMMPSEFNNTWWQNVLAEFEPAQYYSSPHQDVMNDYYGASGTAMRKGEAPPSFMDYLETNPWTERYTSLPQTARGATGTATNPRTRFLYNY